MSARKTAKRFLALLVTLALVIVTNYAISFASGVPVLPNAPRPVVTQSGVPVLPDAPRP